MATATIQLQSGRTPSGDRFYQRQINGTQILIQKNRQRIWHGYVAQKWRRAFTDEEQAVTWLQNYALAEVAH